MRAVLGALLLLLAGCAPTQPTVHAAVPQRWAAVLVAGDGSIPVFDNATGQMARLLEAAGTPATDIHRFSASPDVLSQPRVQLSSKARVLDGIAALRPLPARRAWCS